LAEITAITSRRAHHICSKETIIKIVMVGTNMENKNNLISRNREVMKPEFSKGIEKV